MKLPVKYIAAFLLTATIPIAVLGYLSYSSAKYALKRQILNDLTFVTEAIEGHLYCFLNAIKGRAVDFSSDGFIRDSVVKLQKLDARGNLSARAQRALNTHLNRNKKPLDKTVRLISVLDLNGKVIASTAQDAVGMDKSGKEYFINGMKGVYVSDVYVSEYLSTPEHPYHIAVAAPLTNKRTGALLGVIVNYYETSELHKLFSGEFQVEAGAPSGTLGRSRTLDVYLVNRHKLLCTPSKFSSEVMKQKVETFPVIQSMAGKEISGIYKNYRDSNVVGASMRLPAMGWTLLVEINTDEAFLPVASLRNQVIVLSIPIVMLAFFLAFVLSRESQGAIREIQERFQSFMDNSPAVAFMKDEDGRYVYVNAIFSRYFKITVEDVLGKTDFEIWPMEVARRLRGNDKSVLSSEKDMEIYETVPTPDGVARHWMVFKFPIKDRSGSRYLGGVAVDVTERKQAETLLRETTQRLEAIIQSAPMAILSMDTDGNVRSWNAAAKRMFGWDEQEALGHYLPFVPEEKLEESRALVARVRRGESFTGVETRRQRKDGSPIVISISAAPLYDVAGNINGIMGMAADITEHKKIEERLLKLSIAVEQSPSTIMVTDAKGTIEYVNPKFFQLTGYTPEEVMGRNPRFLKSGMASPEEYQQLWAIITSGKEWRGEFCNKKKNGELYWEAASISAVKNAEGVITHYIAIKEDVTNLKRLTGLLKESNERFRLLIESSQDGILAYDKDFRYTQWNKAMERISGVCRGEVLGKIAFEVFPFLERIGEGDSFRAAIKGKAIVRTGMSYSVAQTNRHGYFDSSHFPLFDAKEEIVGGMCIVKESTERVQAERRLNAQHAVTRVLADATTIGEAAPQILQVICEALGWEVGAMWFVDRQAGILRCAEAWHVPLLEIAEFMSVTRDVTFLQGAGLPGRVWASASPAWIADVIYDSNFLRAPAAAHNGLHGAFGFPVMSGSEILGVIEFFSKEIQPHPDDDLLNMMGAIGRQIGLFFLRKRAEEQTRLQLQRVSGLHDIDLAIAGSFDLHASLVVFLDKVATLLNVDAATVLLLDRHLQTLEYCAGHGFRSDAVKRSRLRLGEEASGRAALERRFIGIPDLAEAGNDFGRRRLFAEEGFVSYYAVPLIAKGHVRGVLEIFHRKPHAPEQGWLEFLDVLATQGAMAVDNALLFDELQRSHDELMMAYDHTIDGWSRALDLRDKETEGHSRRVTEMTLRLARELGMSNEELVHIRHGALLHDIGKVGIPDNILLKPGPLTDVEWEIMRNHPVYAQALLAPIEYLRNALEIPYCHHEKWDGTGYPRGLKGEQIPLAARIFAVVDVWDALTNDRPYRQAWAKERVYNHIRSLAGTHFDPKVVEIFVKYEW